MAKTELTKAIEEAILNWHPAEIGGIKINKFRGEHTALEVPAECGTTAAGIVDAVRISEYFGDIELTHVCRPAFWRKEGIRATIECPKGKDMTGKLEEECDQETCRWNGLKKRGAPKILLTCFEIKITKSDFKSQHGHNFIGNQNYYVVPSELYPEIESLVPEGVGVLVYLHKGMYVGLRTKRRAEFKPMTDEDQKWLLLSVLKRIRDMDYKKYHEWMQRASKPTEWGP